MNSLSKLLRLSSQLTFQEYDRGQLLNSQGQFQWRPPADFALVIKLITFSAGRPAPPLTWHEYLEVFVPLGPQCEMEVGRDVVELKAGDILLVDNLKLHALRSFSGPQMPAIVIRFLPDLIYSMGSFSIDHLFCVPFYHHIEGHPHVIRSSEKDVIPMHHALCHMLECYFGPEGDPYGQSGAKVFFMEFLYHTARRFQVSETLCSDYLHRRHCAQRLRKLFDYTAVHYADKITVPKAAALVGMSRRRFLELFKSMSKVTWMEYLNDVRLTAAAQLIKQTQFSLAEIAARVGYSEQSYLNRRFKKRFGHTPLDFRKRSAP